MSNDLKDLFDIEDLETSYSEQMKHNDTIEGTDTLDTSINDSHNVVFNSRDDLTEVGAIFTAEKIANELLEFQNNDTLNLQVESYPTEKMLMIFSQQHQVRNHHIEPDKCIIIQSQCHWDVLSYRFYQLIKHNNETIPQALYEIVLDDKAFAEQEWVNVLSEHIISAINEVFHNKSFLERG